MITYKDLDKFVTNIVRSLCISSTLPEDLEDIKQDVMLSLLETFDAELLSTAQEHPEYIYVHTRSKVADHFRSISRSLLTYNLDEAIDDVADNIDVPEQVYHLQLLDIIKKLPQKDRELLECYFGIGGDGQVKTLKEIGEVEGITTEAVWKRKAKLLEELRGRLDE